LYQTITDLIGALQWLVTLGFFVNHLSFATMSSFCLAPQIDHLNHIKQLYGYIKHNPTGVIQLEIRINDHERLAPIEDNWSSTIYSDVTEELPPKVMSLTINQDAIPYHDIVNGCAMPGIINFVKKTKCMIYFEAKDC
jgi:hypothetical protein